MLVKNKDSSFLTTKRRSRTIYANFIVQQQKFQQGCGGGPQIESGSASSNEFSNYIIYKEGETLTTPTEQASILANGQCPVTAVVTISPPVDQIVASLSTSLAAYTAAATGDWVEITSSEYSLLQTNVTNTSICGASTSILTTATSGGYSSSPIISANVIDETNVFSLPANTYLYAVAFAYDTDAKANIRIYTNPSKTARTGYVQQGNPLPATTVSSVSVQYYVNKGVSSVSVATAGNMAIFDPNTNTGLCTKIFTNIGIYYVQTGAGVIPNSSTNLNGTNNASTVGFQGLATTTKQWS
ncbi:MAG: hypothetical protein EBU82_08655 [Flavobacteriia bacterium]|nr:hypothetical protein [Flavobacteriia bacterium]